MSPVITFEDFQPGAVMGDTQMTFEPELAERWQSIFGATAPDGADGPAEAASLAVVMMMRAYLDVVAPRPPGNVHARQAFRLEGLPRLGEVVHTQIRCAAKELRRDRRYVELEAHGSGEGGRPLYTGRMTLIWAA